jgi:hypothetical protein
MARADDGRDQGREVLGGPAGASDARLTELLRADSATAFTALQELRARHLPSVLTYARLCTTSESAARQLASEAFTHAARDTGRGIDSGVPWRHQLLLLTGRLAASWARGERAAGLDASLLVVLDAAGPAGPLPPMLPAFQSLPSRDQGLIWYAVVEREPHEVTAGHLGLTRADVAYGTEAALQQLGRACLRTRLAASDDPDCRDFGRLIEESVRPDSPRDSTDLRTHMAHCPYCTTAYEELSALRDDPRRALADGLLPWAGTAYVAGPADAPVERRCRRARAAAVTWPPTRRRLALVSVALGVVLVPLVLYLSARGGSPAQAPVSSVSTAASVPSVAVPVPTTVPSSPSPSPSPTSRPPRPTKSPAPSRSARPKPPPPPTPSATTRPPNGTYAEVVNLASGLCLDIDGAPGNGTDVVTATCTSARDQRWRVDSTRGVLQSYAYPDYCLDSRGSTGLGLGIWTCDSVYGGNGQNLRFAVDSRGVIRPAIAPDHALTPGEDRSLSLVREAGRADQRWRAGRT